MILDWWVCSVVYGSVLFVVFVLQPFINRFLCRFIFARPESYFGRKEVVGPFEIEQTKGGMQGHRECHYIPFGAHLLGMREPLLNKAGHQIGIDDAAYGNPRDIKQDGNEFDANGDKTEINDPWRKALSIKDASGNEEPRIDFDAHTGAHAPLIFRNGVGNHDIQNSRHVVLNNGRRTLDTSGHQENPCQIHDKIGHCHKEKGLKPLARPRVGELTVVSIEGEFGQIIPIPIHDIEGHDGNEDNEVEEIV